MISSFSKSSGNAILETALIGLTVFTVCAVGIFYLGGGFERMFNNKKSAINLAKDMYSIKKGKYENNLISSNFDMSLLNPDLNNAELKKMLVNADSAVEAANIARNRANKANQLYTASKQNVVQQTQNYNAALTRQQSAVQRANMMAQEALAAQQAAKKASEEAMAAAQAAQQAMQQAAQGGNVSAALAAQQAADQARVEAIEATQYANQVFQEATEAKNDAQVAIYEVNEVKQDLDQAVLGEQIAAEDLQLANASADIAEQLAADAQQAVGSEPPPETGGSQGAPANTTDPLAMVNSDNTSVSPNPIEDPILIPDPVAIDPSGSGGNTSPPSVGGLTEPNLGSNTPLKDPPMSDPVVTDPPGNSGGGTGTLPDPNPPSGSDPTPPPTNTNPPIGSDPTPPPTNTNPPIGSDPTPPPTTTDPPVGIVDNGLPSCTQLNACIGVVDPIDPPPLVTPISDPVIIPDIIILPVIEDPKPQIDLALASATLAQAAIINAQLAVYEQMISQQSTYLAQLADSVTQQTTVMNLAGTASNNALQVAMVSLGGVNTSLETTKSSYGTVKDLGTSIGVETAGTYGQNGSGSGSQGGSPGNTNQNLLQSPPPPPQSGSGMPYSAPPSSIDGGDATPPSPSPTPGPTPNPAPDPIIGPPVSIDGGDATPPPGTITTQAQQYFNNVNAYLYDAQQAANTAWSYAYLPQKLGKNYDIQIEQAIYDAEASRDQVVNNANSITVLYNQAQTEKDQAQLALDQATVKADTVSKALADAIAIKNSLPSATDVYSNVVQAQQAVNSTFVTYQNALAVQQELQNTLTLVNQELTSLMGAGGTLQGLLTLKTNAEKTLADATISNDPNAIAAAQQAYNDVFAQLESLEVLQISLENQKTNIMSALTQANSTIATTSQNYMDAVEASNTATLNYVDYQDYVAGIDIIIQRMTDANTTAQTDLQMATTNYNDKNSTYMTLSTTNWLAQEAVTEANQAVTSAYDALNFSIVNRPPVILDPVTPPIVQGEPVEQAAAAF